MKLYEFTFNDNTNLSENEVLAIVQKNLENEAELKGWALGYNFHQSQSPKQLANGEKEYFFVVEGKLNSDTLDGNGGEKSPDQVSRDPGIAASL